jgi:hypothetical protein
MLISINGKQVGGMTEFSLKLELEICGPFLMLVISKYRFSNEGRNQDCQAESQYIRQLDVIANDDRRLDWTDIGANIGGFDSLPGDATPPLLHDDIGYTISQHIETDQVLNTIIAASSNEPSVADDSIVTTSTENDGSTTAFELIINESIRGKTIDPSSSLNELDKQIHEQTSIISTTEECVQGSTGVTNNVTGPNKKTESWQRCKSNAI